MADDKARLSLVIPSKLAEDLKERAGKNHRSVTGEITAILEGVVRQDQVGAE